MGEVFRAHDRLTGQTVALKRTLSLSPAAATPVRRGSLAVTPTRRRAAAVPRTLSLSWTREFAGTAKRTSRPARRDPGKEYRLLASLRHPGIVRVFDEGRDRSGTPYFTMELLDGARHLDAAARERPLRERASLLLQVLRALSYLHRRGVLHRDLKPANILVKPAAGAPRVTLLDFGLATMLAEESARARPAGSVGYMAPEVQRGAPASVASELFSVGVMMHELLVGAHPLAATGMFERLRGFAGSATPFSYDERLGPLLSAVLRRALCFDPAQRYGDAAVLSQELAHAAGLTLPPDHAEVASVLLLT